MGSTRIRYDSSVTWAGVVLVMTDGTKRAIEIVHPHHAMLRIERDEPFGLPEVTVEVSGPAGPWHYGEGAEPTGPVKAIAESTPENERGSR